jgi:hypothetical protein
MRVSPTMRRSISLLIMLCLAALCATNARSQAVTTTLLTSQGFTSSTLPSNWSCSGPWASTSYDSYNSSWFWNSTGQGGSNGSAMDDIWDYSSYSLSTPPINATAYANKNDSVWVDFDFFWEYNGYDAEIGNEDEFEIDGTSAEQLVSGTVASLYTYYNTDDFNFDVAQSSSSYWKHYHILIPVSDRTSKMTVYFTSVPDYELGLSDAAIDNVTITAKSIPPSELALTPKTMNFGTASAGVPVVLYATVSSIGAAGTKLGISSIGFTGATASAYSILPGGAHVGDSIPQGSSEQIGVQFLPLNSGTLTGTLTVGTTGADSGTQAVSLTGVGAVPDVAYSATSMFRGVDVELTYPSPTQYLYVNSTGIGPLTIKSVTFYGLNANNYALTHVPAEAIPGGSVDSIGVQFTPSLEGLPDAYMVITSNAANTPVDTVLLDGVGILPHLAVDSAKSWPLPTAVNFDSVKLGSDSSITVQLWNPGSDTLAIEKNYFDSHDPDFTFVPLTGTDTLIPPGGTQYLHITFTPQQQGTRVATLRIRTDIPHTETTPPQDTSQFVINIVGIGLPGLGKLVVTGTAAYDTMAVGDTECFVDTIWNVGGAPITINSVVAGTNAPAPPLVFWASEYPAVPFVLAPNSYQTVLVCAEPTATGPTGGLFWATATGGGVDSQQYAPLELTIAITQTILVPFASETCAGDSDVASVVVYNLSTFPDTYTAAITGANAADFQVTSPNPSLVLSAGSSTIFLVRFTPSMSGAESALLNITRSSDGALTGSVPLNASGGAATINGSGNAQLTAVGTTSAPFAATVSNTGTCEWTPGIPTFSNPTFAYQGGGTTSIAPGGNSQLLFTYTPTEVGTDNATLSFPSAVGVSIPAANVTITGTATAPAGVATVAESNGFSLDQNSPNPFNNTSTVEITLPVGCLVHLAIINVEGQVVQTVLNQHYDAGSFEITFDATGLASGTYYYQMTAGNVTLTRQMVVMK